MIDVDRSDLEYIRILNDMIAGGCMKIAELKSKAYPGAIQYDDTGGSHPAPVNKLEEVFCLIDKEEKRVNRLIDKRYKLKQQALREILLSCPEYAERHILYLRYLSRSNETGMSLEWSEVETHISKYHNIAKRRMYQLHHIALNRLHRHNI